jgi:hypothetical protein
MTPGDELSIDALLPAEVAINAERIDIEKTRLDTPSLIALFVLAGRFVVSRRRR